jgi:hypothetical protein
MIGDGPGPEGPSGHDGGIVAGDEFRMLDPLTGHE